MPSANNTLKTVVTRIPPELLPLGAVDTFLVEWLHAGAKRRVSRVALLNVRRDMGRGGRQVRSCMSWRARKGKTVLNFGTKLCILYI